ncbi:MAG TPA: NAD(P)-binding domain-containing protein, partial [Roseiflexaceae bacterium]|nr:NAD(P)-binding domain-containing protein [Roseiflexaceae bacterium]
MEQIETVIVGGGQAGLSAGYFLQQHGRDFVILDAHARIGEAWRERWDSLRLFTPARYSSLAGMPFPAAPFAYPTKDSIADYLEAYAARFRLPVKSGVRVDKLSKQGERFVVAAGDLRIEAENVVVATGGYPAPRIPAFAHDLDPAIRQLHSSEYRRPSQLQEGGVLVVGAGNSGAEIALEVAQTHPTWLSGRHPGNEPTRAGSKLDRLVTPLIWFALSHVLTVNTPPGRKVARHLRSHGVPLARVRPADLLAAGVERMHARTVGAQDGLPLLADGRVLDVNNVIWCTGFQPAYGWIALPIVGDDGQPIHERGVVASQPGLYFVGLFFQSAAASSLVGGVSRDAAYIAGRIAARARAAAKVEGHGAYTTL